MSEKTIVGTVGGFQTRTESGGKGEVGGQWNVWNFRVERFDEEGNRLPPIPVQMRALHFDGFVTDGDRIRIDLGSWKPGEILAPKQFFNETTQSTVKIKEQKNCFIATAAFGDPNAEYVVALQTYKSIHLDNNQLGRAFVSLYYGVSPFLARFIAKNELARLVIRALLKGLVRLIFGTPVGNR